MYSESLETIKLTLREMQDELEYRYLFNETKPDGKFLVIREELSDGYIEHTVLINK
jgi:hypothetical protein